MNPENLFVQLDSVCTLYVYKRKSPNLTNVNTLHGRIQTKILREELETNEQVFTETIALVLVTIFLKLSSLAQANAFLWFHTDKSIL